MEDTKRSTDFSDQFISQFMNAESEVLEAKPEGVPQEAAPLQNLLLEQQIVDALRSVYDPEIPINIYDLGLIYDVDVDDSGEVSIAMTLTSPGCPVAQTFPGTVECAVKCVDGVKDAKVELVWDPPWTKDRMSEEALLTLGLL